LAQGNLLRLDVVCRSGRDLHFARPHVLTATVFDGDSLGARVTQVFLLPGGVTCEVFKVIHFRLLLLRRLAFDGTSKTRLVDVGNNALLQLVPEDVIIWLLS
jgi:hypothetical protein